MVGRFLRLRWALTRAGFRTGGALRIVGALFTVLFGVFAGVGLLALGVSLRWMPAESEPYVLPIVCALALLTWVLGPLFIAGQDASLDPVKLSLLPLSRRDLAVGLGAATLLGPGGFVTLMLVVGLGIGTMRANVGAPFVVLGGLLLMATCALTGRLVLSLVSRGMRNRKTRDALSVTVPLLVIVFSQLPNLVSQVMARQSSETNLQAARAGVMVARFLPSSFAAQTIAAGRDGHVLRALLELAGGVLFCVAVAWWWGRLLDKVMTEPPATGASDKGVDAAKPWVPPLLQGLPPRARAVAGKDLKLMLREPVQRVNLVMVMIFLLAAIIAPAIFLRHPLAAFIVVGVAWMLGLSQANMYGYDGPSQWVNVAAGDDARGDLLGKIAARLVLLVPVVVIGGVVTALLQRPALVGAVVGAGLAVGLATLGASVIASTVAPYPITYSEDNLMARNQGSWPAFIVQMLSMPAIALVAGPFVGAAMWFHTRPGLSTVCGLLGGAVGALALWGCWAVASRYSGPRQPELLEKISKRAAA